MDDKARLVLIEFVRDEGRRVLGDENRIVAHLEQHCGDMRPEIHVLVCALKERIPKSIVGIVTESLQDALRSLSVQLQNSWGLSEDAANWAVDSWAMAMGKIQVPVLPPTSMNAPHGVDIAENDRAVQHSAQHQCSESLFPPPGSSGVLRGCLLKLFILSLYFTVTTLLLLWLTGLSWIVWDFVFGNML